ncbi:MAG TPA: hypothetical protein V6D47_10405 [Oscillatoriaceae cyanobacterium]
MKHTLELNDRQLEIIHDLLEERLEDLEEDITHYEQNPAELAEMSEPGEEPLTVSDYEHYRDEVQSLLSLVDAAG